MNQELARNTHQAYEGYSKLKVSAEDRNASHLDELNYILQRKKARILDPKSVESEKNKSLTETIKKNVLKDHKDGIWRLSYSKEPVYGIHAAELPHIVRGNSGHQVFFAEARIADHATEIAIKPFIFRPENGDKNPSPEKALIELINTDLVMEKGIQTLMPLACIINGQTGFYLSQVRHGIRGLDLQIWPNYIQKTDEESRSNTSSKLKKIAVNLANMHILGIFHGDAQIKNFVTTPEGAIMPIDWESSTIYEKATKEQFLRGAHKDLLSLLKSLYRTPDNFGAGIFHDLEPEKNIWPHFHETVVKPYINEILNIGDGSSFPPDLLEAIGYLETNIKESSRSILTYSSNMR
jgi:hypothetical protein